MKIMRMETVKSELVKVTKSKANLRNYQITSVQKRLRGCDD